MKEIKRLTNQYFLNQSQYDGVLYHEVDYPNLRQSELLYHLFKGGNDPVFRCLWRYDQENRAFYIGYIWFDHDLYEREIEQKIQTLGIDLEWEEFSPQVYQS